MEVRREGPVTLSIHVATKCMKSLSLVKFNDCNLAVLSTTRNIILNPSGGFVQYGCVEQPSLWALDINLH